MRSIITLPNCSKIKSNFITTWWVNARRNSIANALELRLSCTNPSIHFLPKYSQKTLHISPSPASYGVTFVSSWSDLCPVLVTDMLHDDVIKWKHFPCYWPFVRGIHQSLVDSPHKGQWCWALVVFDLRLNKLLSKQSRSWWFEKPSCSLWHHCHAICKIVLGQAMSKGGSTVLLQQETSPSSVTADHKGWDMGVFCLFEICSL